MDCIWQITLDLRNSDVVSRVLVSLFVLKFINYYQYKLYK